MENKNTETSFKYTYSAKEQDEIKRIRQKYQEQEADGMSKLRQMDAMVSRKATVVSLVMGIVGALFLGSGMSLIMTDIGAVFGITKMLSMVGGIMIGLPGIILVVAAYPVYNTVLKKERKKIAPEILRLSEELMK